jgi:hypothetical protein
MQNRQKSLDSKKSAATPVLIEETGATLPALHRQATTAITTAIGLTPEQMLQVVASETTIDLDLDALLERASQSHRFTDLFERYDAVFYWRLGRDLTAAKALCPHGEWSKRLKARRISPWQWHQAKHLYSSFEDSSRIAKKTLTAILKEIGIYQEDKGKSERDEPEAPVINEGSPSSAMQRGPNIARTTDNPRTADTSRIESGPTPSSEEQPEAQAEPVDGNPPEDALPLAVDFSPPPSEIELPSNLVDVVEWLRRSAIWLAWIFADSEPAPRYVETHQRFLRVVEGWCRCRPRAVADHRRGRAG